ncbi:MAG: SHOCT domain-containing protein [Candidatus Adiutricales bacterium]
MVMMLAFWGLVMVALFFFIKWMIQATKGQTNNQTAGARALDILMERYARGEIEREEYEEKKADLNQ